MLLVGLLAVLLGCAHVHAKAVFAHFMVENAKLWTVDQWKVDIKLAQAAHIDGFALNIRADDMTLGTSLSVAFEAADDLDFKMIFSYDYAGGGPWSSNVVVSMMLLYSGYSSYYKDAKRRPVVSTFEGPGQAGDWEYIIKRTNAAFIPDWSSLGAKAALDAAPCIPHGLFSWAPWPWGNTNGNTYVDASYVEFLEAAEKSCGSDMQYMMPASPWFYTNLPGYNKNWLWRGDDLWFDRWEQIRFLGPDYVQIISWNDFGESHHIGPLYVEGDSYEAFTVGEAPFNYALDMPHDGWRELLPFTIDLYKTGVATITREKLVTWYRVTPKNASCDDGWTTGNTASQLQFEFSPQDVVQDKVFYSALLAGNQAVTVTVGGVNLGATWTKIPSGGVGMYHGSVDFGSNTGAVVVTVGSMTVNDRSITNRCDDTSGYLNWNAYVASTTGAAVSATVNSTQWVCVEGTAADGFDELCTFTCRYGYCPVGACLCTKMGPGIKLPDEDTPGYGTVGFPAQGRSASYGGLCSFACNYGFPCPNTYCDTTEHELVIPSVSPFTPDACTSGVGEGGLGGLCGFACNFGFCPIRSCTCTSTGALHVPPAQSKFVSGKADASVDERIYGPLCEFTCSRGYCPEGVCIQTEINEGNPSKKVNAAYIGPEVYMSQRAACESPCVLVLPPSGLPSTTTIKLPPYKTSFQVGSTTTTTTLYPSDIITDKIWYSNINITGSVTDGAVFPRCTSLKPEDIPITLSYVSNSRTTVTIRQVELPPWPQITQGPPDQWTSTCGGSTEGSTTEEPIIITIPSPSSTTATPIYTYGVFPPARVEPIVQPMDPQCRDNSCPEEDDDDDDSVVIIRVKCDELWFFIFCINTNNVKIFGWKFIFPRSTIGPGPPPPLINLISGWKFIRPPKFPHWPKITVGPGLKYPDKPSGCDSNKLEVPVEIYTRSFGLSVSNGVTLTTTTRTITETAYETGCPLPQYTTTAGCGGGRGMAKRQTQTPSAAAPVATISSASDTDRTQHPTLTARADRPDDWRDDMVDDCTEKHNYAFYVGDYALESDIDWIMTRLSYTGLYHHRYQHNALRTVLVYVLQCSESLRDKIFAMPGFSNYEYWKGDVVELAEATTSRKVQGSRPMSPPATSSNKTKPEMRRRAVESPLLDDTNSWHRSQISSYPSEQWNADGRIFDFNIGYQHPYYHDGVLGAGQYIYLTEEGLDIYDELQGANIVQFEVEKPIFNGSPSPSWGMHAKIVAQYIVGESLGLVPRATLVTMKDSFTTTTAVAGARVADLIMLLAIIKDIETHQRQGRCVISNSITASARPRYPEWEREYVKMLRYLEGTLNCVWVNAASNTDGVIDYADQCPPTMWRFTGDVSNMIIVGTSSKHSLRGLGSLPKSDGTDDGFIFAPGVNLYNGQGVNPVTGTSVAAPLVAGLVAYLRAMPSPFFHDLKSPAFVSKLISFMTREVQVTDPRNDYDWSREYNGIPRKVIWNGNVGNENCLIGYYIGYLSSEARAICEVLIASLPEPGNTDSWTPGNMGGGSSSDGRVTWSSGPVQPTCTANCGTLCIGFYCVPKPTGNPPDFADPINKMTTKTTSTRSTRPTSTSTKTTPTAHIPTPQADCFIW
ncbi:glycosyl hydrolase family 71-domain-containing protein [Triangularia verruculosa]|uniref:Glycosyl hydrolase family 71-domain-containing protein n=1 Tax=Triangularia verruculosa TaxID=2587418 RepID=A0AAN6XL20_9PEZI|nr:glycosyl hydrolase family 71-domain-containing protein [Triangularia verruculosa]